MEVKSLEWRSVGRIDSLEGTVCKYVFMKDDAVAEAVLYRYPDYQTRTVICCSTQSGCPVGCRFCGAGDHFVRNLSTDEIIEQVEHAIMATGLHPREIKKFQVMFMSMGEPLLNMKNLLRVLPTLHFQYPDAALLVSTVGPRVNYEPFIDVSRAIPTVGLQFSVHRTTDEERDKLIPFRAKLNLTGISEAGERWFRNTARHPFFNYCASEDNITEEDADRLLALYPPAIWKCTISVVCERNEGFATRDHRQAELARMFSKKMLQRGYDVRVFDPAGQDDIGGGCGQLWFVQRWMKEHLALPRQL